MDESVPLLCGELFTNVEGCPIQFSMPICPEKENIRRKVEENGGHLTSMTGGLNTVRLVPPGMKSSSSSFDIFSTKYIDDCLEQEKLLNLNRYRIGKSLFTGRVDVNDIMVAKNSWRDCEQQLEELGEEVSDLEDDYDLPRKQKKNVNYPTRRDYTHQERKAILHYIIDNKKYNEVKGRYLWQEMEKAEVCPGRTWGSMKEHFRKNIVNNLHLFRLTRKEINRLTAPFVWGKYEERRHVSSDDTDESEYVGENKDMGRSPRMTAAGGNHRKRDKHRDKEKEIPSLSGATPTVEKRVYEGPKGSPCKMEKFVYSDNRESQRINRLADRQLPEREAESVARRSPIREAYENQSTEINEGLIEKETDVDSDVTVISDSEKEADISKEMIRLNETDTINVVNKNIVNAIRRELILTKKPSRNQSSEECAFRKNSENLPCRLQLPDVICSTSNLCNSQPFDVIFSSEKFLDSSPIKDLPSSLDQGINIVENTPDVDGKSKGITDNAEKSKDIASWEELPSARDIEEMNELMFSQVDVSVPSPSRNKVAGSPRKGIVNPSGQLTSSDTNIKSPQSYRTRSSIKSPLGHVRSSPNHATRSGCGIEARKVSGGSSDFFQNPTSSQETEVFESCQDHSTVTSKPQLNVAEPVFHETRFNSNLVEPFLKTESSLSDSSLSSNKSTIIFPDNSQAKKRKGGRDMTFSIKCNVNEDTESESDHNHSCVYTKGKRLKKRQLKDTCTREYKESLPSQSRGDYSSSSSDSEIRVQGTSSLEIVLPEISSPDESIVLRRDTRAKIPKMVYPKDLEEKHAQKNLAVFDIPPSESDIEIESCKSDSLIEISDDDPAEFKDNFTGNYDRNYIPNMGSVKSSKKIRVPYSTKEDVMILKYMIKHRGHGKINGRELWQDMARRVLPNRTWQSLKERYRMRIAHRLPLYIRHGIAEAHLKDLAKVSQCDGPVVKEAECSRRPYTRKEDFLILKFITENKRHSQVGGKMLWILMSESIPQLSDRTWLSLKERFRRTIMKNIDDYSLSKDDVRKFLKRKSMQQSSKSIRKYFTRVKNSKSTSEDEDSLTESDDYDEQSQSIGDKSRSPKLQNSQEDECKKIIEKHLSKWPQPSTSRHVSAEPSKEESNISYSSKEKDVENKHTGKRKLFTPVLRLANLYTAQEEKTIKVASEKSPVSTKVVETSKFTKDALDASQKDKHDETAIDKSDDGIDESDEIPLDVVKDKVKLRLGGDSRSQKEGSPNVTSSTDQIIDQPTVSMKETNDSVQGLEENEVDSTQGTQEVAQSSDPLLYTGGNQSSESEYNADVDKSLSPTKGNLKLLPDGISHKGFISSQQANLDLALSQTSHSVKVKGDIEIPNNKNCSRYLREIIGLDVRNISPRPRPRNTNESTTVRSRLRRKPLRKTK